VTVCGKRRDQTLVDGKVPKRAAPTVVEDFRVCAFRARLGRVPLPCRVTSAWPDGMHDSGSSHVRTNRMFLHVTRSVSCGPSSHGAAVAMFCWRA